MAKKIVKKKKDKTLKQIKKGVKEAEEAKVEVIQTAETFGFKKTEQKSRVVSFLAGTIVCLGIMALGALERSRLLMTIGGVGFLSFLGMVLYEWSK